MTYDDDHLLVEIPGIGAVRIPCVDAGIEWPPPERINFTSTKLPIAAGVYVRESYSLITDEQRAGLQRVMRGARYVPDRGAPN